MNLTIKVIAGRSLVWQTICKVPDEIYKDFSYAVQLEDLDINSYLSVWAKQDWSIYLDMSVIDNIDRLKHYIEYSNKRAYPELYAFRDYGLEPSSDFWISLWVTSHMKDETEIRKYDNSSGLRWCDSK